MQCIKQTYDGFLTLNQTINYAYKNAKNRSFFLLRLW